MPKIRQAPRRALAAVGGGPSLEHFIDELRKWNGDIWISGSAFPWCMAHGIDGVFFTLDQLPIMAEYGRGAKEAVLATCCDPSVFDALAGADIQVFDLIHEGPEVNHHVTSITAVPSIATQMGYRDITFFGCDSSFTDTHTHVYSDAPVIDLMRIQCGGETFLVDPSMLLQGEFLGTLIAEFPKTFKVRGTGFLPKMIEFQDYDITHGTPDLARRVFEDFKAAQSSAAQSQAQIGKELT